MAATVPAGLLGMAASGALSLGHRGADDPVCAAAEDADDPDEDDRVPQRFRFEHECDHPEHERLCDGLHAVEGVGQDVPAYVLRPADVANLPRHLHQVLDQLAEPDPDAVEQVSEPDEDVTDHARRAVVEGQRVVRVVEELSSYEQPDDDEREHLMVPGIAEPRLDEAKAGLEEEPVNSIDEDEGDDCCGDGQEASESSGKGSVVKKNTVMIAEKWGFVKAKKYLSLRILAEFYWHRIEKSAKM